MRIFDALTTLDPNEDWGYFKPMHNYPESKAENYRIYFGLYVQDYGIPKDKLEFLKQKCDPSIFENSKKYEYDLRTSNQEMRKKFVSKPFGTAKDVMGSKNPKKAKFPEWSVDGFFRKVSLKTRELNGKRVIQGMKVELEDGTVKAFGMEVNDTDDVQEFVVPEGQHIKDVLLKSGNYIECLIFKTLGTFEIEI